MEEEEKEGGEEGSPLGLLMLLRILRLLKLLRVTRVLKVFRELNMLCDGVLQSLRLLLWSVLLLTLLTFAAAIFCTREIGIYWSAAAAGAGFGAEETERMAELFGSMANSMYTLFQIQTLESWSELIARPVMRRQ